MLVLFTSPISTLPSTFIVIGLHGAVNNFCNGRFNLFSGTAANDEPDGKFLLIPSVPKTDKFLRICCPFKAVKLYIASLRDLLN